MSNRFSSLWLASVLLLALCPGSRGDVDWLVDILPGTALATLGADGFSVTGADGKERLSLISTLPNVSAGCVIELPKVNVDVKLGAGLLLNSKISAYFLQLIVGFGSEIRPSIFVGAHAGLTYFTEPEWWGDTDVEFSDTTGFIVGMHLVTGDRISYLLSLDYAFLHNQVLPQMGYKGRMQLYRKLRPCILNTNPF